MRRRVLAIAALFALMAGGNMLAQTSTNPAVYTSIVENTRRGGTIALNSTFGEIDDQSAAHHRPRISQYRSDLSLESAFRAIISAAPEAADPQRAAGRSF